MAMHKLAMHKLAMHRPVHLPVQQLNRSSATSKSIENNPPPTTATTTIRTHGFILHLPGRWFCRRRLGRGRIGCGGPQGSPDRCAFKVQGRSRVCLEAPLDCHPRGACSPAHPDRQHRHHPQAKEPRVCPLLPIVPTLYGPRALAPIRLPPRERHPRRQAIQRHPQAFGQKAVAIFLCPSKARRAGPPHWRPRLDLPELSRWLVSRHELALRLLGSVPPVLRRSRHRPGLFFPCLAQHSRDALLDRRTALAGQFEPQPRSPSHSTLPIDQSTNRPHSLSLSLSRS